MADGDRSAADFPPFSRLTLDAYARATSQPQHCVHAAFLRVSLGCSWERIASMMTQYKRTTLREGAVGVFRQAGMFINPAWRLRTSNVLSDGRIPSVLRERALMIAFRSTFRISRRRSCGSDTFASTTSANA